MQLSTSHRPAYVPYWNEVKSLSKKDKIQLITLLSTSLLEAEDAYTPMSAEKSSQPSSASARLNALAGAFSACKVTDWKKEKAEALEEKYGL